MELVFNLWILSLMAVFIIDYSGFIQEMEKYLSKLLNSKVLLKIPKPFNCSLCMSWWAGLIYLIFNSFTFSNLLYLTLISALTPVTLHFIYTVRELLEKALTLLDTLINR